MLLFYLCHRRLFFYFIGQKIIVIEDIEIIYFCFLISKTLAPKRIAKILSEKLHMNISPAATF